MAQNVKLLVCIHKAGFFLSRPPYLPIQAGKAIAPIDLGLTGDDSGDNISAKNRSFCELTVLYWAWRNLTCVDVVGLCHYRRYFEYSRSCRRGEIVVAQSRYESYDTGFRADVLSECDIVLASPRRFHCTLEEQYCRRHVSGHFGVLREVVAQLFPADLLAFDEVMGGCFLSPFNMFIARRGIFDEFCEWLFKILFEVERRIGKPQDAYQARVFGFLGERCLNVFCRARGLRVRFRPVIVVCEDGKRRWRQIFSWLGDFVPRRRVDEFGVG